MLTRTASRGRYSIKFRSTCTGWTRSKQEQLRLTVTRAFQIIKELSFDVCHEKAIWMLGFSSRCLFERLARAMTKNVLYIRANFRCTVFEVKVQIEDDV